ncbi:TPA: hypothetical protein DD617_01045 [Candidatus Uhrbacteria bacterium]|nr:hypothetical protein [Candidatus Uhrbacteria bacterium]
MWKEIKRFNHFQKVVLGSDGKQEAVEAEVNIRTYAKYLLKEGGITEKRELLGNLKSKLIYRDKIVRLLEESPVKN